MKTFTKPSHDWWRNGIAATQTPENSAKRIAALRANPALRQHWKSSANAMLTPEARARRKAAVDARIRPPSVRFWEKVNKTEGCWEWTAGLLRTGYGSFGLSAKKPIKAHRYSWILAHGEIPAGMCICHHCDNRKCVRPDHLFIGTIADNNADGRRKGRIKHRVWSKLTLDNVAEIRSGDSTKVRCEQLGRKFGVSWGLVYRVAKRKIWKDQP